MDHHSASDCLKHTNVNHRLEVAKRKGLCSNWLKKQQNGSYMLLNAIEDHAETAAESTTEHFTRNASEKEKY